jgi:thiol-disulfide isomerase/thioredoxin
MTAKWQLHLTALAICVGIGAASSFAADPPTATQALGLKPIQPHVEYAIPGKEEAAACTIRAEKENNVTAWVVRNRQGEVLRRFADTNGDNVVDMWCYFLNGVEVYRDVDSNYNGKADQYRWFNTAGMRWGVDKNEDGRVDSWRAISPHEVAEQVVLALKGRDAGRFELLLLTPEELNDSGFGKPRAEKLAEVLKTAPDRFSKLAAEQKVVGAESRFIDFGSARPARIPTGTGSSTKDVIVLDNAAALVETGGKHEQVFLGAVVAVGETWKLLDVPTVGSQAQPGQGDFLLGPLAQTPAAAPGGNAPNDEMQKLMAELDQLYREGERLPAEKQAANIDQRAEKLERLAKMAPEGDREQWYRQLAGLFSVGMQTGSYPKGGERLELLQKKLEDAEASEEIIAAVAFQRLWADYVIAQQKTDGDAGKVLEKWLADLEKFVNDYPKSSDAAEALLQLGMYQEFAGKNEEATKWYRQLIQNFPKAEQAPKANGALRRLSSIGKPVPLRGTDLRGETVDLQAAPYRGRVVLIHYWATWCVPCKADMAYLKDVFAKRGGNDFQIIGVCLDADAAEARRYISENRFAWRHIHEPGGLDGRLANEMGVMTLPLTVLVDQKGNVVSHNIHVGPELETELAKLIRPTTGTATSPRDNTPRR